MGPHWVVCISPPPPPPQPPGRDNGNGKWAKSKPNLAHPPTSITMCSTKSIGSLVARVLVRKCPTTQTKSSTQYYVPFHDHVTIFLPYQTRADPYHPPIEFDGPSLTAMAPPLASPSNPIPDSLK